MAPVNSDSVQAVVDEEEGFEALVVVVGRADTGSSGGGGGGGSSVALGASFVPSCNTCLDVVDDAPK